VVGLIFVGIYFIAFRPLFMILNGYSAKRICSSHFIAERSLESVKNQDLIFPASLSSSTIDHEQQIVHSSVYGIAEQSAKYRPGFGCTLSLKESQFPSTPRLQLQHPQIKSHFTLNKNLVNVDYEMLVKAVTNSFDTADRTRAVLVLHQGKLIAEQYQDGFDKSTELLGWSMTKSIANNLVGILVKEGKLRINQQSLLPEWTDERANITLEELLHMSSDLDWNEEYGYLSDVTRMLYLNDDASEYAINKDIRFQNGTSFIYSSGTTNIISRIIKNTFNDEASYLKFPHKTLFEKLDIHATMELDMQNQYIMSSYTYMTARDWAKLGQFWLQKGRWKGEKILPDHWMDYSTTAGNGINSLYGAHFWLNTDNILYPDVPSDMYSARGFQGQQVIVIPSQETVIVRFGVDEGIETFDFNKLMSDILLSIDYK